MPKAFFYYGTGNYRGIWCPDSGISVYEQNGTGVTVSCGAGNTGINDCADYHLCHLLYSPEKSRRESQEMKDCAVFAGKFIILNILP